MSKLLVVSLVSVFMLATLIFAFQCNSPISGQVVAASTSISIAALRLHLQFKKPSLDHSFISNRKSSWR